MDLMDCYIIWEKNKNLPIDYQKCGISESDFTIILSEFLSWLQLEHKRSLWIKEGRPARLKPMTLNEKYPKFQMIRKLVENENYFHRYFRIQGNQLDFREEISEDYKIQLREKAYKIHMASPRHILYYKDY